MYVSRSVSNETFDRLLHGRDRDSVSVLVSPAYPLLQQSVVDALAEIPCGMAGRGFRIYRLSVFLTQPISPLLSLQDCLLQMGLIESVYWLAWLATFAVTAAITATVVVRTSHLHTTLFAFKNFRR
jgi:hypothetical protein